MRSLLAYSLTTLSVAVVAVTFAHAQSGHRQLGAHEHGQGILNIAVEGARVSMELAVPGADIVGFEHEAATEEQKAEFQSAKEKLSAGLSLFRLDADAGCKLVDTQITYATDDEGADHDGDHAHEHAENSAAGHDHAHKDKDEAPHHEDHAKEHDHTHEGEHAHHAEFRVTYDIKCETPASLTGIAFGYFDVFKNAERLEVNVVTDKGQTSLQATRDKPELSLSGLM